MAGCKVLAASERISATLANQTYMEQKYESNASGFVLTYTHIHTHKNKLNCRNLHALARFHCSWTILEEAETAYFLGHIQHFHMMTCPCYSISAELGQNIINNKSKMHQFVVFLTQLTGWKRPERETSLILEPWSSAAHKPAIKDKII